MDTKVAGLVLAVFCWGVVSLGAHSIGHEEPYRTLALLLAQPRGRTQILAHKAIVLIPLVLALTLVTTVSLSRSWIGPVAGHRRATDAAAPRGPVRRLARAAPGDAGPRHSPCDGGHACDPWCPAADRRARGELAVRPLAIPSRCGRSNSISCSRSRSTICAAAAIATWWQFERLQAIESHQHVHAPTWRLWRASQGAASPVRVRRATWVVFRKELHLQQLSYLVVGMYVIAWGALWLTAGRPSTTPRVALQPLTVMYVGLLSLLIGSVASAEERQLGTLTSQQLLPMAVWKQWVIKAGTALGLALLLGILLPVFLNAVIPVPDDPLTMRLTRELRVAVAAVLLLSTLSLYVSSLSGSAVRAMVTSIPVALGAGLYASATAALVSRIAYRAVIEPPRSEPRGTGRDDDERGGQDGICPGAQPWSSWSCCCCASLTSTIAATIGATRRTLTRGGGPVRGVDTLPALAAPQLAIADAMDGELLRRRSRAPP